MKGKREAPLGLDMPFDEALARFLQTDPVEVAELAKRRRSPEQSPPPSLTNGGDNTGEPAQSAGSESGSKS